MDGSPFNMSAHDAYAGASQSTPSVLTSMHMFHTRPDSVYTLLQSKCREGCKGKGSFRCSCSLLRLLSPPPTGANTHWGGWRRGTGARARLPRQGQQRFVFVLLEFAGCLGCT